MPIIARGSTPRTPAPAGVHQAVCVDVIDLGMVKSTYEGKESLKHKVNIRWQIDEVDPEHEGRRFQVQKRYTLSLHEKAGLRKDLQSWRGKPFTAEEVKGFDVERLLGVNCQINVVHVTSSDGNVYGNVDAIMPLGKGMPKIEPLDYIREVDRKPTDQPGREPGSDDEEGEPIEDNGF